MVRYTAVMRGSCQKILRVAAFLCMGPVLIAQGEDKPARAADHAAPVAEASWMRRIAEHQGVLTNGRFDVVFLGDSLTEFWTSIGKATWPEAFAPLKCAACGIAGDRTEHLLYRIERLDFRRAGPRVFVLLMGTNNLGMETPDNPEDVVRAILRGANLLVRRHPAARIVILGIPPCGFEPVSPLRTAIAQTNALLAKANLPPQASLVPTFTLFTDESGRWREGLTLDGTHFSAAGYAKLAELLAPKLRELLGIK
jgi:lysophospholipase L1-like esterase